MGAKIVGGHSIIYSTNADADRAFLQNVLKLPHVDVGRGWLIFGLPPAELAVHPSDTNDHYEFYFMVDDVRAWVAEMARHNIACAAVNDQGYGLVTSVTLPGGGKLGVYQPRHARPKPMSVRKTAKPAPKRRATRSAKKTKSKSPRKTSRSR